MTPAPATSANAAHEPEEDRNRGSARRDETRRQQLRQVSPLAANNTRKLAPNARPTRARLRDPFGVPLLRLRLLRVGGCVRWAEQQHRTASEQAAAASRTGRSRSRAQQPPRQRVATTHWMPNAVVTPSHTGQGLYLVASTSVATKVLSGSSTGTMTTNAASAPASHSTHARAYPCVI
jgi:hypothetical protein